MFDKARTAFKGTQRKRANIEVAGTALKDVLPKLDKPWWCYPHILKLNLLLTAPLMYSYLSGFDGSMMNGLQSLPTWKNDFDNPQGSRLSLMASMQTIGAVVILPIAPWLTDHLGRRHPVMIGSLMCILAAGIQGGARNFDMFIWGRFLIGAGGGLVNNACGPLVAELTYPSQRPFVTALYSTTWFLGSIVAAWSTYGTFKMGNSWSWRIPSILQAAPSVYQLLLIYFLPESPRYLCKRGQVEKARSILAKYHAGGDENSDYVALEVKEIQAALELETLSNKRSWLDFFATKGNRWRFFIVFIMGLMFQWAGNGILSFYLIKVFESVGITDPEVQNLINGGLQLFNYATAVSGCFFVERLGRRFLLLFSTVGMFFTYLIWTILSALHQTSDDPARGLGVGIVVMIFLYSACYNWGYNIVPYMYALEILPYTLRAKGMTVFATTGCGSIVFNGFVNNIAMDAIGWKYYIVWLAALILWFVLIFLLFPETKGRSLEEISEIFDGENVLRTAEDEDDIKKPTTAVYHENKN